jgi:hypothetical protein
LSGEQAAPGVTPVLSPRRVGMGESTTGPRSAFDEVRVAFEPLRAGLELRGHELEGAQGVLRVLITVALGELLEGERHHQPAERVAGAVLPLGDVEPATPIPSHSILDVHLLLELSVYNDCEHAVAPEAPR